MTLRTPRRRISPRAMRKYSIIRNFFRRALGNQSQSNIKINSSIALNVTDLKHTVIGLENQINEVNKQCYNLAYLESTIRNETEKLLPRAESRSLTAPHQTSSSATQLLFKPANFHSRKSDDSDFASNVSQGRSESRNNKTLPPKMKTKVFEQKKHKSKLDNKIMPEREGEQSAQKLRPLILQENATCAATNCSLHSLGSSRTRCPRQYLELRRDAGRVHRHHTEPTVDQPELGDRNQLNEIKKRKRSYSPKYKEGKHCKTRDKKRLDEQYLADILKKQYTPIEIFGRTDSDISKFSVPVCRDCECPQYLEKHTSCYEYPRERRCHPQRDYADVRSICDTRLYSSKRTRTRHRDKRLDDYHDSAFYDVIPVKEKPNIRSKRKLVEDDMYYEHYYKEVPPSPRTQRPRLNLKAQYFTDYEDNDNIRHSRKKYLNNKQKWRDEHEDNITSDVTSAILNRKQKNKSKHINLNKNETYTQINHDATPNEQMHVTNAPVNSSDKTHTPDQLDKKNQDLFEIKHILLNFLQEIKKETRPSASDSRETAVSHPVSGGCTGFIPSCVNPCCCSMMPVYPINYMQKSYIAPSRSVSCHTCSVSHEWKPKKDSTQLIKDSNMSNETETLIKEIYKYVAQNQIQQMSQDKQSCEKVLTSRIVDNSCQGKLDAQVGTPALSYISKSCETMGSKVFTNSYTSQTDAAVAKSTVEVSTQSDMVLCANDITFQQIKESKFKKALRFINLLKAKKMTKTVNTETECSFVDALFPKETSKYMVNEQKLSNLPLLSTSEGTHSASEPAAPYQHYPPRVSYQEIHERRSTHYLHRPCYQNLTLNNPTESGCDLDSSEEFPLYLKEIEVRSTGTQSDRKLRFFNRLYNKMSVSRNCAPVTRGTQTSTKIQSQSESPKLSLFKKIHEKVRADLNVVENLGDNTQKKLKEGDMAMRNAMVKKLFLKKNPFSQNNSIVKTLLGEPSSALPSRLRPKIFFKELP